MKQKNFRLLISIIITLSILIFTPTGTKAAESSWSDNFNAYKIQSYSDGTSFGSWFVQFAGYGAVNIKSNNKNKFLELVPKIAKSTNETHAALVTGKSLSGNILFQTKITTTQQLRTGSTPNPWEVGWVVWNYTDNEHFYYFIPKTNGWELGKRDPSYTGGQRFLATGSNIKFPIKRTYTVKVTQDTSNTVTVWVNGNKITSFTDKELPYTSGAIGFYSEDARVIVDDVLLSN